MKAKMKAKIKKKTRMKWNVQVLAQEQIKKIQPGRCARERKSAAPVPREGRTTGQRGTALLLSMALLVWLPAGCAGSWLQPPASGECAGQEVLRAKSSEVEAGGEVSAGSGSWWPARGDLTACHGSGSGKTVHVLRPRHHKPTAGVTPPVINEETCISGHLLTCRGSGRIRYGTGAGTIRKHPWRK